jgi:lysophospholipase L1-like esterase
MTTPLTDEQRDYILQFQHPEKMLSRMPGVSPDLVARLFDVSARRREEVRAGFTGAVQSAAREILADPANAEALGRLPLCAGQTCLALGDSITDDWQSWFEILRAVFALRRPGEDVTFVNAGISGDTTTHAICRFLDVVERQPDWILCFLGTNDCRLHGMSPAKVLVSPAETQRNLEMLRNFGATQTSARWIWVTPCRVVESLIPRHWFLGSMQLMWRNADLDTVAGLVRRMPDPAIDLQGLFDGPGAADLLLPDGLHPNLAGQKAICRQVIRAWAGLVG